MKTAHVLNCYKTDKTSLTKTFKIFLPFKSFYQLCYIFKGKISQNTAMILYSYSLTWGWAVSWHIYMIKIPSNGSKFIFFSTWTFRDFIFRLSCPQLCYCANVLFKTIWLKNSIAGTIENTLMKQILANSHKLIGK